MLPFLNEASMSKTGLKRLPLVQGRKTKKKKKNDELLCWFYKQQIQINQSEDLPWKLCMHHGLWFAATLLPNWSMINIRLNISGQGTFDLCSAVHSSAPLACSGSFWIIHSLEYKLETVSANYNCQVQTHLNVIYCKCTKNEQKKMMCFFFLEGGGSCFLIQCQRTRRWVWEWRCESDVRGQGQTEQRWKELFYWGFFITWCYPRGWEPGRGDVPASSSTAW